MSDKLKNRFIVIGIVLVCSILFVWPPFNDPPLVTRTVERMVGAVAPLKDKVLDWEDGSPLNKAVDILGEDDDHVVEVNDGRWYRYFIRRRFDATPGGDVKNYQTVKEEERTFKDRSGEGSKKLKVRIVRYRQELRVRHTLNLGLDLSGGTEIVYRVEEQRADAEAEESTSANRRAAQVESIVKIIETRINISGLKEPRIQAQGTDRVLIQIPGRDPAEVENIKRIIQTSGRLEFRAVVDNEQVLRDAEQTELPDHKWYHMEQEEGAESEGEKLLIKTDDPYNVTGADLGAAYVTQDDNGLPAVGFRFKVGRGQKFGWMSQEHMGKRIAIILDGKVFSAPVIRARIDTAGIIEGGSSGFTYQQAKNLATILSAGSLPADLVLEMENQVSPFIGDDSIRSGLEATLIGSILVFIFMLAYYAVGGAVTDVALAFNILILLGALAMWHATLTLPGIAGIALTVGMAVDANVLIFERIREERLKRTTVLQALEAGFDRAFITIFDSNLTTVIVALILIYIGTGPVRGFGITLTLGIAASMFTAIYVAKTILLFMFEKNILKDIRMASLPFVKNANFPFLKWGKPAMIGSAIVLTAGMAFFFWRGRDNLDIDFRGGYMVHIKFREPAKTEDVRKWVGTADLRKPEVQPYGAATENGFTDFVIRTEKDYSFSFIKEPTRAEDGRVSAVLQFNEHVNAEIIRDRLNQYKEFSNARVEEEEKENQVTLSVDAGAMDEAEIRRNIRKELEAMPKYDLAKVPEIGERLHKGAFEMVGEVLNVELMKGEKPETINELLKPSDLGGLDIQGVGQPDEEGKYRAFQIKAESDKLLKAQEIFQESEKLQLAGPFPRYTQIGTAVAGDMVWKALAALVLSWVAMLIYVGIRFHGVKYGAAAIVALIHDALFTMIALAVFDYLGLVDGKINLTMIAALLTIIGYSVNDTIVIFDRVREHVQINNRPSDYPDLVNLSNNEMLGRTILTTGVTLLAVLSLYVWGGGVIHGFAFAMLAGCLSGTYSTVFIACPIVVAWDRVFGSTNQP